MAAHQAGTGHAVTHTVVSFDGAELHVEETGAPRLARTLRAALDRLVPAGPVVLGGHSRGGMTVMALAEQRPELFQDRIAGVLLTNPSAGGLNRLTLGFPQAMAAPVRNGIIR